MDVQTKSEKQSKPEQNSKAAFTAAAALAVTLGSGIYFLGFHEHELAGSYQIGQITPDFLRDGYYRLTSTDPDSEFPAALQDSRAHFLVAASQMEGISPGDCLKPVVRGIGDRPMYSTDIIWTVIEPNKVPCPQ